MANCSTKMLKKTPSFLPFQFRAFNYYSSILCHALPALFLKKLKDQKMPTKEGEKRRIDRPTLCCLVAPFVIEQQY